MSTSDILAAQGIPSTHKGLKTRTTSERNLFAGRKSTVIPLAGVEDLTNMFNADLEDSSKLSETENETITEINCKTKITYHQLYEFGKLFEANKLGLRMLEKSFSPELNREQVFKTGEGSGKSGSFFFLTHDKRFMIKTIS